MDEKKYNKQGFNDKDLTLEQEKIINKAKNKKYLHVDINFFKYLKKKKQNTEK